MTLKELKRRVRPIREKRTPSGKALKASGFPVIIKIRIHGALITVFENGYVLYQADGRSTVVSIERCDDFCYRIDSNKTVLDFDFFLDQDCGLILYLICEAQLQNNQENTIHYRAGRSLDEPGIQEIGCSIDPEEEMIQREMMEEVFSRMTPRQRTLMNLYYIQGYRDREIANRLGISENSVRVMKTRGMKRVKERIQLSWGGVCCSQSVPTDDKKNPKNS